MVARAGGAGDGRFAGGSSDVSVQRHDGRRVRDSRAGQQRQLQSAGVVVVVVAVAVTVAAVMAIRHATDAMVRTGTVG